MDIPAVFGTDATEVEDLALATLYCRKRGARHLHQAVRLRHFSGTGVLAARRTIDEKKPGRKGPVAMLKLWCAGSVMALRQRCRAPAGPVASSMATFEALAAHVADHCDATLAELVDWSERERGVKVCIATMSATLDVLDLSLKKRRAMLPSRREPMSPQRARNGARPKAA